MTNKELNRKMAEVMGWNEIYTDLAGLEWYWTGVKGSGLAYERQFWQPTEHIEQAMMVLDKIKMEMLGSALDEPEMETLRSQSRTLALAICLAIAEAMKGGEGCVGQGSIGPS